ncbi:MAG: hypothetical protein WBV61_13155 [Rhodanobacteraceae bacterium]
MKSAPTIAFEYQPSRLVLGASVAITLLAVAAILASGLGMPLRAGFALFAILTSAYALWRFTHPILRGVAHGDAGWILRVDGDREEPAILCGHSQAGPMQTLDFSCEDRRRLRIVLTPDNTDSETFRRLRLILERSDSIAMR